MTKIVAVDQVAVLTPAGALGTTPQNAVAAQFPLLSVDMNGVVPNSAGFAQIFPAYIDDVTDPAKPQLKLLSDAATQTYVDVGASVGIEEIAALIAPAVRDIPAGNIPAVTPFATYRLTDSTLLGAQGLADGEYFNVIAPLVNQATLTHASDTVDSIANAFKFDTVSGTDQVIPASDKRIYKITRIGSVLRVSGALSNADVVAAFSDQDVKTKYEANDNTNAFTDADRLKLAGLTPEDAASVKAKYESNADTNAFTDAEKAKLITLDDHYKGTFLSLAALNNAEPTGEAGDYADVDAGVGQPVQRYAWDPTDTQWEPVAGDLPTETAASVKTKYESNADTNAFTDAEKSKLAGLVQHYRGLHFTLAALNAAVPSGNAGDYADVDGGAGQAVTRYVWDTSDAEWLPSAGDIPAETNESVKTKYEANADTNAFTDAEKVKLADLENETAATVKTKYESNADTNAFTDAEKSKLGTLTPEDAASVKTKYESNADTNAFTDAEKSKLGTLTAEDAASVKTKYESNADTNAFTDADRSKLDSLDQHFRGTYSSLGQLNAAVPAGNPGDFADVDAGLGQNIQRYIWDASDAEWQPAAGDIPAETAASVKTKYESNVNTNAFTDADKSKLDGLQVEDAASIKGKYEANANTNAFTDAEKSKLTSLDDHFKGVHLSLAALQAAHPTANAGDYADVDGGAGNPVQRYAWDPTDTQWEPVAGDPTSETAQSIKTKYEGNADTNAFTDAEKAKLGSLEQHYRGLHFTLAALNAAVPVGQPGDYADVDAGAGAAIQRYAWDSSDQEWQPSSGDIPAETAASVKAKYESNADTNAFTDAEQAKLAGLTAEDAASVKTKYESNADTNAFTDAEKSKLAGLTPETAATVKTKYESNADTNAFTDADKTKLDDVIAPARTSGAIIAAGATLTVLTNAQATAAGSLHRIDVIDAANPENFCEIKIIGGAVPSVRVIDEKVNELEWGNGAADASIFIQNTGTSSKTVNVLRTSEMFV